MNDLILACGECGRTTALDAATQTKILGELTRPAQAKIIECSCGRYQFVLSAAPIRRRELAEAAR
jgi:hypothetical protein